MLFNSLSVVFEPPPHDALHRARSRLPLPSRLLIHRPAAPVQPPYVLFTLLGVIRVLVEA